MLNPNTNNNNNDNAKCEQCQNELTEKDVLCLCEKCYEEFVKSLDEEFEKNLKIKWRK